MGDNPATYPSAEEDRIFCPDCGRAVFYQRVHVSTHEADCPPEPPS